jgi:hypothetical protein
LKGGIQLEFTLQELDEHFRNTTLIEMNRPGNPAAASVYIYTDTGNVTASNREKFLRVSGAQHKKRELG